MRYYSSNPIFDGTTRNVEVVVNYDGNQATTEGSYVPGDAPQIERTQATIDLHTQPWAEGTEFTIEVEITDEIEPYTESATLYYKNTTESVYQSVSMYQTGKGEIWQGIIPGSDVETPGLDYYIKATDGHSTSFDPSDDAMNNPYQFAILPNEAPVIIHTPLISYTISTPITINADITDITNELVYAGLFYRKTGDLTYEEVDMTNIFGDTYEAEITADYVTADGVDYYIKAEDNFSVGSYHGTSDNPNQIEPFLTYGFLRNPNAWGFNNSRYELWPNGSPRFPTLELFMEAFNILIPTPGDLLYYAFLQLLHIKNTNGWGGACYGMAYTSQLIKDGHHILSAFDWTNEDYPWDIKHAHSNEGCRNYINEYYLYQFGAIQQTLSFGYLLDIKLFGIDRTIDRLRQALKNNNIAALSLFWKDSENKNYGHSVTPLNLEKISSFPEVYRVMIYDNSYNNIDRELRINVTNNSWEYVNSPYFSMDQTTNIFLDVPTTLQIIPPVVPVSLPIPKDEPIEPIEEGNYILLGINEEKDIQIESNEGILGFQDGEIIDDFVSGSYFYPIFEEGEFFKPPMYYFQNTSIDCKIINVDDSDYEFYYFKEGTAYHFMKENVYENTEDILSIDSLEIGYRFSTTSAEDQKFNSKILKISQENEKLFNLENLQLSNIDTLSIIITDLNRDNEDNLILTNCGSHQEINFEIEFFRDNSLIIFETRDLQIDSSSYYYFYPQWDSLEIKPMKIEIDNNMDGTIDDTLYVENQFSEGETPSTCGVLNNNNIYIYPNPFNPDIEVGTIRYSLAKDGKVTIKIYDVAGNLVKTLIENEPQIAGEEQYIDWDGKNGKGDIVANGVYFYVIESSSGEKGVGKIAIIK